MQKKNQTDLLDYDSEDDEDYVPPEEKGGKQKEAEVEAVDEDQLTGIEALRNKKRNREVDDLFELMNAEDPIKKAMNERKRQNTGSSAQLAKGSGCESKAPKKVDATKVAEKQIKAVSKDDDDFDLKDLDDS